MSAVTAANAGRIGPNAIIQTTAALRQQVRDARAHALLYAATLETLLVRLVTPRARVVETQCEAAGASACEFALRLG